MHYVCIWLYLHTQSTIISYSIDVAVAFDSFETGFSYGKTEAYHSVFPGLEFCCALIPLFRPCALAFLGRGLADAGWFGNTGRLPKPKQTYAEVPNLSTSFFGSARCQVRSAKLQTVRQTDFPTPTTACSSILKRVVSYIIIDHH